MPVYSCPFFLRSLRLKRILKI